MPETCRCWSNPMDTIKRLKLQKYRDEIVQDLDIKEVCDQLVAHSVLTENDVQNISSEVSRKDRARHLLDILPGKDPLAFDCLVTSLEKSYPWLSSLLAKPLDCKIKEHEMQRFSDAVLLGGLPSLPRHNVDRADKLADVRRSLKSLKRGYYVVLHGMAGSGKSCLAANALYDKEMLVHTFKGCVFWLSVGDVIAEDLLSPMLQLLDKVNVKSRQEREVPTDTDRAQALLRSAFLPEIFRSGLLILDDVTSHELIEKFDIGCKILVTTKDKGCMRKVRNRYHCIMLNHGFSKQESLSLLSKCVGISTKKLPHQAIKIHDLCKGVPLVIALIGAQLAEHRDDVIVNKGRWDYYLDKLTKRDYRNIKRGAHELSQEGLMGAIGLSIDNLPDDMRRYYEYFALFVEDVNIKPEVLETLWEMNKYEVEDQMMEFMNRSLAVCMWNEQLKSYVYGIHDLLLFYLKEQLTDEKRKELHQTLLARYRVICGSKLSDLPTNDNYIFSYLGYHLNQAEEWHTFKTLYFDLEFLGAKLKTSGLGDLMVDFRKYRHHITGGIASEEEKLCDYEHFVHNDGMNLFRYPDLDVVQCALQQPRRSQVYKDAVCLATERTGRLYLELLLDRDTSNQPTTLLLKQDVTAACFTENPNRILVANGNGHINLWDVEFARILYTFRGHTAPVSSLQLCPSEQQFLSASEDDSVKLWNLENIICHDSTSEEYDQYGCALKTPSPRMRQNSWTPMHGNGDVKVDTSVQTFFHGTTVSHAAYSHDGMKVVSCGGMEVKMWECSGKALFTLTAPASAATCTFSWDDTLVIFSSGDDVLVHDAVSGVFLYSLRSPGLVVSILPVPDNESSLVVATRVSVQLWSLDDLAPTEICVCKAGNYICFAITQDGCSVIVGDTNHKITVWQLEEERQLLHQYQDHSGWVQCLDTYWLEDGHLVLSGSEDQTIKVWTLAPPEEIPSSSKLKPVFHAVWPTERTDQLPVLAVAGFNCVQVQHGCRLLAELSCDASVCQVSIDGSQVAYGCTNGHVYLIDLTTKPTNGRSDANLKRSTSRTDNEPREILTLEGGSVHYLRFLPHCNAVTLVAASSIMWQIWTEDRGCILKSPLNYLVQCFSTNLGQKLITCSQDSSVKVWNTNNLHSSSLLVGSNPAAHITMADMSREENLIAMTDTSASIRLVALDASTPSLTSLQSYKLGAESLQSCSFNKDARILAVGLDSGSIVLWDVQNHESYATLHLHKTWVRDLVFSPTQSSILVSVGEVLGFWDISALTAPRRRRRSGARPRNITFEQATDNLWCTKRGSGGKPELLGCMRLAATHAQRIDASPDFSLFTTVDMSGNVYHLKIFQGLQQKSSLTARHQLRLRSRVN